MSKHSSLKLVESVANEGKKKDSSNQADNDSNVGLHPPSLIPKIKVQTKRKIMKKENPSQRNQ